jgi:hypothetical protein
MAIVSLSNTIVGDMLGLSVPSRTHSRYFATRSTPCESWPDEVGVDEPPRDGGSLVGMASCASHDAGDEVDELLCVDELHRFLFFSRPAVQRGSCAECFPGAIIRSRFR